MQPNEPLNRLISVVKKASANIRIAKKIEAEQGDFRVEITTQGIHQFYKNKLASTIPTSSLENDVIDLINSNSEEAAQAVLTTFAANFDEAKFQKEAANAVIDKETAYMTTEKQLEDQKTKLHPRQKEYANVTTEKQIPDDGQRPGTFDITTEGQLREERNTFYGDKREAGDWKDEDRTIVTEGQLGGAKEYSDLQATERGEMAAKYDGGVKEQHMVTETKQLIELLRHHQYQEPHTVTEGPDQLGKQEGELARLTAESAKHIVKESLSALGNTVIALCMVPDRVAAVAQRLVSHESKFAPLAKVIKAYRNASIKPIQDKIAKARHFGKAANASREWSDELAADAIVRQMAKIDAEPIHIVTALSVLSGDESFVNRVAAASNAALEVTTDQPKLGKQAAVSPLHMFKQALNYDVIDDGTDDGSYRIEGPVEDVKVSTEDKEKFAAAAFEFAKNQVKIATGHDVNVVADECVVNEDGTFAVTLYDADSEAVKTGKLARRRQREELLKAAKEDEILTKTAAKKEAQVPPGPGDMTAGAGGGAGGGMAPAAPPGQGDMNAPPMENFTEEPPAEEGAEGTGEPKPPGSTCPVCGSEDVDIDNGEIRCNNCGAEGQIHIRIDMNKWPETIKENEKGEEEPGEEGMGLEEEGPEMGAAGAGGGGTTMPGQTPANVPVAASVRITPRMIEKLAAQNVEIGKVCPNCGSSKTDVMHAASGYEGLCFECNQDWKLQFHGTPEKKQVRANIIWTPAVDSHCSECERQNHLKQAFVQALHDYGMRWSEFDSLPTMNHQGEVILKMAAAGVLDLSQVVQQPLPLEKYASVHGIKKYATFPMDSCKERIARRYGENATSMSGPCRGKPLADCVCQQLAAANGIYSDGLAAKVAAVHLTKDGDISDPMGSCVAAFIKEYNYKPDDACLVCDGLRAAYATSEDLIIEAIAKINPFKSKGYKPTSPYNGQLHNQKGKAVSPKKAQLDLAAKPMQGEAVMDKPLPKPAKPMMDVGAPAPTPAKPMMGAGSPAADPAKPMMGAPMPAPKPMAGGAPVGGGSSAGTTMPPVAAKPLDEPEADTGAPDAGIGEGDMGEPGPEADVEVVQMDDGMPEGGIGEEPVGDGMGGDMGIGGPNEVALNLGNAIMDAIKEVMTNGVSPDMVEGGLGEDPTNVGDVTEDVVDDNGEGPTGEGPTEGLEVADEGAPEGIPGLDHEESEETGGLVKDTGEGEDKECSDVSSKPCNTPSKTMPEGKEEPKPCNALKGKKKPAEAPAAPKEMPEEPAAEPKELKAAQLDALLYGMKKGTISGHSRQSSSMDNMIDNLLKFAKKDKQDVQKTEYKGSSEKKISDKSMQDEWQEPYSKPEKSKMGYEDTFSAKKPDIARGKALLGAEESDKALDDKDRPSIPTKSDGALRNEKGVYKSDGKAVYDPNQGGQSVVAYTVDSNHRLYTKLAQKLASGVKSVKLTDGKTYSISQAANGIHLAEEKSSKIKKESDLKSLNRNDKAVQEDKDIGKVKEDAVHSRSRTEQKPSEGVSEPDVPEAPNAGRLSREHTYDTKLDGPQIPAGGGVTEHDEVEKYHPEKQTDTIGQDKSLGSTASYEEAVKIAGQMLKASLITEEELPAKIKQLASADKGVLNDYRKMITQATTKPELGLQKQASVDAVETVVTTSSSNNENRDELKTTLQSLFRLDKRNRDFEQFEEERGANSLWR